MCNHSTTMYLYLVPFGPLVIELLAKYLQKHDDNFVKIVLQYNAMTLHAWKVLQYSYNICWAALLITNQIKGVIQFINTASLYGFSHGQPTSV